MTEALETEMVDLVAEYADIIQIGARNMQNSRCSGGRATGKPVLLKRGLSATIKELLLSAEYILAEGNTRSSSVSAASEASKPHPQPPRPDRDPGRPRALAPPDHRRSVATATGSAQGRPDGARGRRRGRRRPA